MQRSGARADGTFRSAQMSSDVHIESEGGLHKGGLSKGCIDVCMKWRLYCLCQQVTRVPPFDVYAQINTVVGLAMK